MSMNKKGEGRGGSLSSYFYLLLLFFLSFLSLCYVNSEQAMFYLLIAFPSERQGRKLSQPAFAITCISRQIHTYAFPFHTYWLWRGFRTSQRSKESVVFFSFFYVGFVFKTSSRQPPFELVLTYVKLI